MATLKELKGRIASVRSTLKITSAMKLVASSKLRRAQLAIEAMRPYEKQLQDILQALLSTGARLPETSSPKEDAPVAIVAISSNSSLCGGFNANVISRLRELLVDYPGATVYSIGRKVADAVRKSGRTSGGVFNELSEKPAYSEASALAEKLSEDFYDGKFSKVILVYNHFVSTARQVPVAEVMLPAELPEVDSDFALPADFIVEPSPEEMLAALFPKTIKLKLFTALLDSAAAEHAARTIAMQTATDNGENILAELTLQYNKSRQQKITTEILDLAGGKVEE